MIYQIDTFPPHLHKQVHWLEACGLRSHKSVVILALASLVTLAKSLSCSLHRLGYIVVTTKGTYTSTGPKRISHNGVEIIFLCVASFNTMRSQGQAKNMRAAKGARRPKRRRARADVQARRPDVQAKHKPRPRQKMCTANAFLSGNLYI